jgi:hypothetical protein
MKTKIVICLITLFWIINSAALIPTNKDFPGVENVSIRNDVGRGENAILQQTEFISLFNGKDLTGWGTRIKTQDAVVFESLDGKTESKDKRFSGKDGMITINPWVESNGERWVNLWTAKEFPGDFVLTLEFRASVNADSGIFLRGRQLQCRDYLVAGPYKNLKNYKPQDWNKIEVVVKNNIAHCTCNGEIIEDAYNLPPTGPIGFEADHGQMDYRNIQVKELQ